MESGPGIELLGRDPGAYVVGNASDAAGLRKVSAELPEELLQGFGGSGGALD